MNPATISPVADSRWNPRVWGLLVVLCGALFLDALDVSMVGVALPSIRADLGLSTASLQWVVSGYVLGYGGLLLLGGRAADLLGRRRVFLAALAVFAVASLLGGLVSTAALLIAARLVKGMAAAFTAPGRHADRPALSRAAPGPCPGPCDEVGWAAGHREVPGREVRGLAPGEAECPPGPARGVRGRRPPPLGGSPRTAPPPGSPVVGPSVTLDNSNTAWPAEVRDGSKPMPGPRGFRPARPGVPRRPVRGAGDAATG